LGNLRIVIEGAGKSQRTVSAPVRGIAELAEHLIVVRRQLFRRDVRGPPLVGDQRNVHDMEDLVGRVCLRDGEGLAGIDHPALQVGGEVALVRRSRGSAFQVFAAALAAG
jgi:hypothetical protein